MQLGPMPPAPEPAGGPSPAPAEAPAAAPDQRNHFNEFVNKNSYIPVWLHPDVAHGVIRHFGRDGRAIVHPHPASGQDGMAGGGVVDPTATAAAKGAAPAAQAGPPAAMARPPAAVTPLAGIAGDARSIFNGGPVGSAGPTDRTPVFAKNGAVLDARAGMGSVPGVDLGRDTEHAMLEPGEAVFNKEQLGGITVKKGKGHLVRPDQKQAMRKASKRNAR